MRKTPADSNRVKSLLASGDHHLFKPEELKSDLDTALVFFLAALEVSSHLNDERWTKACTWQLSRCYFERGEVAQGRAAFMQIVQNIQKKGDKAEEADTWMQMGTHMVRNKNTFEEISHYYRQAILLCEQLGEKEKAIDLRKAIADVYLVQGKLDESEKGLLEVIEQYKAIGFPNLHYTYDLLAAVSTLKGNLNRALYFGIEMIKSMEATGDSASAAHFYYRLGRIYDELGQPDKSFEWFKKAYAKEVLSSYGLCNILVINLITLGRPKEALAYSNELYKKQPPREEKERAFYATMQGNCYQALEQFDLAEKYYRDMIYSERLLQKQNTFTSTVNLTMAQFFVKRHRYEDAAPYLKRILAIPEGVVTTQRLKNTYLLLFKVDSAAGNYLSAIRYFQIHKHLNDSIFNATKSRQIEELQIQYETEKKETDIAWLQNEKDLQHVQLQQATFTRNITFGTGALLLVVLALLYNRYRLKQRVNKQLEIQQGEINQTNRALHHLLEEKERLLREIHHRVKNNLQIVMSLLNSQSVFLDNDKAITAIRDSQQRIHSISLIHQKLYQSETISRIDMSVYIRELVDYLQDSFDTGRHIRFDLQTESIELDVTQAVPVGLILNEAISNSIKYAFPDKQPGIITISMQQNEENQIELLVSDNGVGLPRGFNIQESNSLGLGLMSGLSKQLHGDFELKNDRGLAVLARFEQDESDVYRSSNVLPNRIQSSL